MTMTHPLNQAARLSVAPMLDWTDRHCRMFHRAISQNALLYTEMVTVPAILHGDRARLLDYSPAEHPVALQLGGSVPQDLVRAVRIAADWGYDEVNLNLGCPSDRVQAGCFGAALMAEPGLVGDCLAAMVAASPVPVTAKTRIGIDDQNPAEVLPAFLEVIRAAGVRRVIIHARKAWLQGLSPRDNREIPPLDYPLVLAMKRAFPDLHISINGGVADLAQARDLLAQGLDGVMVGRAAYYTPMAVLGGADAALWGGAGTADPHEVAARMRPYIIDHLAGGGRLHHVTRHMLGLFHGLPGARGWRRHFSGGVPDDVAHYDAGVVAMAASMEQPHSA